MGSRDQGFLCPNKLFRLSYRHAGPATGTESVNTTAFIAIYPSECRSPVTSHNGTYGELPENCPPRPHSGLGYRLSKPLITIAFLSPLV